MLDRPWNPFLFQPFCCSRFRINNKRKKQKRNQKPRRRISSHTWRRLYWASTSFSPLLFFFFFFYFCSLPRHILCAFKRHSSSLLAVSILIFFFFTFLVKPVHSLSQYHAAVWSLPPLASQSGRTLQQVQQLVRDPSLFKCSILSKLEDLSETTSVVSEIGIYLARLLRVCLVRVVSMCLSPMQREPQC